MWLGYVRRINVQSTFVESERENSSISAFDTEQFESMAYALRKSRRFKPILKHLLAYQVRRKLPIDLNSSAASVVAALQQVLV